MKTYEWRRFFKGHSAVDADRTTLPLWWTTRAVTYLDDSVISNLQGDLKEINILKKRRGKKTQTESNQ